MFAVEGEENYLNVCSGALGTKQRCFPALFIFSFLHFLASSFPEFLTPLFSVFPFRSFFIFLLPSFFLLSFSHLFSSSSFTPPLVFLFFNSTSCSPSFLPNCVSWYGPYGLVPETRSLTVSFKHFAVLQDFIMNVLPLLASCKGRPA